MPTLPDDQITDNARELGLVIFRETLANGGTGEDAVLILLAAAAMLTANGTRDNATPSDQAIISHEIAEAMKDLTMQSFRERFGAVN
ncbi:MAG: hypothetical protein RLW87_06930 [Alphaproteobacteria bacterium]